MQTLFDVTEWVYVRTGVGWSVLVILDSFLPELR